MTEPAETLTPGQVAQNEAAKQAVVLVFGLVTVLIIMQMQKKMARDMGEAAREGSMPDSARSRRMQDAKRMEHLWDAAGSRVMKWALKLADIAWKRAEQARQSYESESA